MRGLIPRGMGDPGCNDLMRINASQSVHMVPALLASHSRLIVAQPRQRTFAPHGVRKAQVCEKGQQGQASQLLREMAQHKKGRRECWVAVSLCRCELLTAALDSTPSSSQAREMGSPCDQ